MSKAVPALEEVYDQWATRLFRYAYAITANRDDAEDVVAEVFGAMARSGRDIKPGKLASYLYVSVRNASYGVLRRRGREAASAYSMDEPVPGADTARLEMREALMALPLEQREVVILKAVNGLTFDEIGAATQVSPATAASRYRYALARLRKELEVSVDG